MKREPFFEDPGELSDCGYETPVTTDPFENTVDEELLIDIKFNFPLHTNSLEETQPAANNDYYVPVAFLKNEDEAGEDKVANVELEETDPIVSEGVVVEVQEMKPAVDLPIPIIIRSALELEESDDNDDNEIIIKNTKRKPEVKKTAIPIPSLCTICNTGFPTQWLLQLHMSSSHEDQRPFPCSHCGKLFSNISGMKKHETIHNKNRYKGEARFGCDLCDKKYHIKGSLDTHRKIQHLGYKPKRPTTQMKKIVRVHHSIGVKNPRAPKKEVKLFKCPHCDLKYDMRYLLLKHMICHTRERRFHCKECGQPCASGNVLRTHMRNRHLNPSNNPRPSRPAFMSNQPCPCTICGKVYKVPSQLNKHMMVHTGERPHECSECGQRFRLKLGMLRHFKRLHVVQGRKERLNPNETYKCRICGKDDFVVYSDLRNHRLGSHRHIPIPSDSETEMPYGCAICGKPWNTRGQAMVCTLLRHDPTSLHKAMFRYKCPRCPEQSFGFHGTIALRRHWEELHPDKPLPVQYRAPSGMYENREDTLPSVTVNKTLAKQIRECGPEVKSEYPLYIEFHLLPVQHKFYIEVRKGRPRPRKPEREKKLNYTCNICGNTIVHLYNFNRHMKKHAEQKFKQSYRCGVCGKKFWKLKNCLLHEQQHQDPDFGVKRPRGRPRNPPGEATNPDSGAGEQKFRLAYPYICGVCGKGFRKSATRKLHEQKHKKVTEKRRVGRPRKIPLASGSDPDQFSDPVKLLTVNVNDTAAVREILGGRSLSVVLDRHVGPTKISGVGGGDLCQ